VDQIITGQVYDFLGADATTGATGGKLGSAVTSTFLLDLREDMNVNKCPLPGRNLLITPSQEATFLDIEKFTSAERVADSGIAMKDAYLGRRYGFDIYMCQNMPSYTASDVIGTGAINNGNIAAGSTVLTVDGFSSELIEVGQWCTIAGDMQPQLITAETGSPTATSITISPGLRYAVVDGAVVTVYGHAEVNLGDGYAANYAKAMVIDGVTLAPRTGQLCSTGVTAATLKTYSAIDPTPTTIALNLNRGLESAVLDDATIGLGPPGDYGWAFTRNAVSFVSRPLAAPQAGAGALSAVANYKNLGIRVTITYDGDKQGHLVTVDMLCGVKTLDTDLGGVLMGT
jgi:hypothetical protein